MEKITDLYNESFFAHRHKLLWRAPIICKAIITTLPECFQPVHGTGSGLYNVVDAGCAIGEFVSEFIRMGSSAYGLEGSTAARKYMTTQNYTICDLRIPLKRIYVVGDLCISLEVAEHIAEDYAQPYIQNLAKISNTILISAAKPGQKGHGHVNCQPQEYWRDKFEQLGYHSDLAAEEMFRRCLEPWQKQKGISGYFNNTMIYKKGKK